MVPENILPHRSKNILFIGETNLSFFPFRPYAYYFYKHLTNMGHQVRAIGSETFPGGGPFGYQDVMQRCPGFQPDLILSVESYPISLQFNPQSLAGKVSVPTAFLSFDTLLRYEDHARIGSYFNYVFLAHLDFLNYFSHHCRAKAYWLPYACDPEIQRPLPGQGETLDLGFVGTAWSIPGLYQTRILYLQSLQKLFKCHFQEWGTEEELAAIYAKSKIVFNYGEGNGMNPRIFEALSYGKMLLTNRTAALGNILADKAHLVFYDNLPQLVELIRFYLAHPEIRQKIAARGQARVWRKHTFYHRADLLMRRIFGPDIYLP
jgi:hypothetical protein